MQLVSYDQSTVVVFTQGATAGDYWSGFLVKNPVVEKPQWLNAIVEDAQATGTFRELIQFGQYAHGEKGVYHEAADATLFCLPNSLNGTTSVKSETGNTVVRTIVSLCPWGTAGQYIPPNGGRRPYIVGTVDYMCRLWDFAVISGKLTLRLCSYHYSGASSSKPEEWPNVTATWYEYQVRQGTASQLTMVDHRKTATKQIAVGKWYLTTTPPPTYSFGSWVRNATRQGYSLLTPPKVPDISYLKKKVKEGLSWLTSVGLGQDDNATWDDLTVDCVTQCKRLDTNLYTLLPELVNLGKGMSTLVADAAKLARNPSIRKVANMELSLKYGVQLTVKDVISSHKLWTKYRRRKGGWENAHSIRRVSTQMPTPHGGLANVSRYSSLKIWYKPTPKHPLSAAVWNMYSYGVYPSVENSWDMIPFSFCVDWLIDVQKTCRQIDTGTLVAAIQCDLVLYGSKVVADLNVSNIPDLRGLVGGTIHYVKYYRRSGPLRSPQPSLYAASGQFHNYAEAGAIITQLTTKR